ncbi:hypothetical protein HNO92_001374 [Chromobacterium alkanivorans]|uniref:hypothetical protein n=1 Tax=Chromobacterium alkanivorans TaxID=1071719 RepID=UPI00216A2788|nr:hypothetical protein [Chromobacterium alkanivorans]MCS3804726.1 hypothetical protein [Chromobacterium alkanivorans]MCS3873077.1 hypothetical protein [Chromobacterium alkanivorans]
MYHEYIPLSQPFSPCLALAREIVNAFLEAVQNLLRGARRGERRVASSPRNPAAPQALDPGRRLPCGGFPRAVLNITGFDFFI